MPEANDVKNQFLDAISVMSPNFHETWVLRLQDKGDIEFTELLNRYKAHWKITYGKQASQRGISKAVFATWQGHEEVKPNETKQEETPLGDRACPCGRGFKKHQPWKCWEIFEDIRPKNYKPVASARQKWEKAMKANPTWKALVEKERTEMSQSKKPTEQANVTLGGEAFGFFTTPAIPTKISEIPTEKRWVVDTGAQVHVCNDRRLFVTFEDAQSVVKGFQYPKLSPENLILATKKSAQEPRSEGSIHTWHRRLGHVGTERIEKLAEMTEGITIESNPGKKKQSCHLNNEHRETSQRALKHRISSLAQEAGSRGSIQTMQHTSHLLKKSHQAYFAFTQSMNQRFKTKPHREDLPPPPENWIQMKNHRFAKEFMAAASFEVLPLKWVFTYKFDANGVLEKFKARICVRGDLQWLSTDEKRAATLAVKTARAVFALVAAFDLDMRQRDVVTAFLNSSLQSETYTKCPPGFEREGHCWMLHRALYGLRMSPRLWQQEATRYQKTLHFTTNGIIVFFYVDDIIIVNHPNFAKQATKLDQDLKKEWEMRELDATWFLNIRILRDRDQKKLWLCQDSYIESMTNKYNLVTTRKVGSPLGVEPLVPYDGVATPSQIHGYQAKVGSAQYATTISRPDAAKATSKVAEFLTNPGPKHMDAIDRIIQYLYETRYWAISENNPGLSLAAKSIEFASDASFGDNRDRKSSEGYLCKLYGGPLTGKRLNNRLLRHRPQKQNFLPSQKQEKPSNGGAESSIH
ncbi:hypothetical protein PDIDSM_5296 [Penicillium digitatum]|nr:hypothetical protein PDIDSM_5296 [Penicillium digitatum]